ncbi:hypothetical protein IC757_04940 [Wenzhouxiangella sp. AB-CW3]|uniref:hypothetical protein n=1 Tax=Wenzhouxiangella sp. AB-CW3 TaxID=2771012 RepID=UPI00168B7E06|nr:hypothetical protein [Wenzhouxiangella sp. AB-CW3]QOC23489.1 hypothetical protein IC757_04940 [Wenzhouxiangella sp. AB-CW3]
MSSSLHALTVGGLIVDDAHWTLADSPVIVSSSLQVKESAQLRVDPGVIVAFDHGVSLEVVSGALHAQGTVNDPVQFVSLRKIEGKSPGAGDWGSVVITPGAQMSATLLEHVHVRHGHGIQILGGSPQINHVHLESNSGAAIDLDLAASPHGKGLTASGNTIDGIRVPPGQIVDDVVWALRGIPYVLKEGEIRVGRSAYALLPESLTLTTGVVAELEVVIPQPADAEGLELDLVSSVPGVAWVPDTVEFESGQSQATFLIEAMAPGESQVSASHSSLGLTSAMVEVVEPPSLDLEPQSPSIGIGESVLFHASLSEVAGTGGLPVTVTSEPEGILDTPEQLFIPEGGESDSFGVSGLAQGSAMLTLSADGYVAVSTPVDVIPPSIQLPLAIFASPGTSRTVPLSLSHPAPEVGLAVSLSASDPGVVELPDSVFVDAGATDAEFEISGLETGEVMITASADDFVEGQMQVTVAELSLALDPDTDPWLPLGVSRNYGVRLSDPAPAGGLEISVSVTNPDQVELSTETLIIPPGQIQATESLSMTGAEMGETELELSFEGSQPRVYPVRVTEALEVRFSRTSMTVGRGLISHPSVLNASLWSGDEQFRPFEDFELPIVCAEPAICELQDTVVVAQGDLSTRVSLHGLGVGQSLLDVDSEMLAVGTEAEVTVVDPELRIQELSGTRSVGSARDSVRLRWYVPDGTSSNSQHSTMAETSTVQLSIVEDEPAGLIDGIWDQSSGGQQITAFEISAGTNRTGRFYVGTPATDGSYRVRAAIDGLVESVSSEQFVQTPELAFTRSSMVTGRGLVSYPWVLQIERQVDGSAFDGAEPLEVDLACQDETICQAPTTVTIQAHQSRTQVPVTGTGLGQTNLTAVAPDYQDAEPAQISVVDPELRIQSLAGIRSVGSARDSARMRWYVPGGTSSNYSWSTMAETSEVELSIVEDEPEGLIDGLWSTSDGGQPIESLTFPSGDHRSSWFYVGTPDQAGVYRVRAHIDGLVDSVSAEQTVLPPELSFNRASMVAGRGLVSAPGVLEIRRMVDGSLFDGIESIEVHLSCEDTDICQVPATVTIPAGQSRVWIPVTGTGVGVTTVLASAAGHEPAEPAGIEVVDPQVRFDNLAGTRSVGSARDSLRLRWEVPGGTSSNRLSSRMAETSTVALSIVGDDPVGLIDGIWNSASEGELITQISFAADSNRSDWIYVGTPSMAGSYRVSAEIPGLLDQQSGVQTVVLPELRFSRSEAVAGEGMTSTSGYLWVRRQADGSNSATAEDVTISLTCSAVEVCSTPETITLGAGSHQVSVPLTGTGTGATTLSASAAGHLPASSIPVTTYRPRIQFTNLSTSMSEGSQQTYRLRLRVDESQSSLSYQVEEPFVFDLSSNFPSVLGLLDQTATISSGNRSGWVGIEAVGIGHAQITASGSGLEPRTSAEVEVSP